MKRHSILRTFLFLLMLTLILTACAPASVGTSETPNDIATTDRILTLVGPKGGNILTLAQLKELPAIQGQAGIKSSTGQITIPELFKGVALKDLVAYLNVAFDPSMGVTITAEDGYSMTFSYDQVMNGNFVAFDPATGNELPTHDPLTAMIAYEHNGQPLNTSEEGRLRLVVVSPKNNQVVDGHWSVKWVNKVEVTTVGETWTLDLRGAIISPVTRDSYMSCGAPSCHGSMWQDENGQEWVGVPLWLLVGEVDDADSHSDVAYNRSLADSGYSVDIVNSEGITVTVDSQSIKEDNQVIVAHLVNDAELPEIYYPLRLVGASLQPSQMLGQITSIVVNVPPIPDAKSAAAPENAGSLAIMGMVNQELSLNDADLKAMDTIKVTTEVKEVSQDFQGVSLNALLNLAGLKDDASKLVFTASDGYSSDVNLSDVQDCPYAMVAFLDTPGTYMIVLPDLATSTWVKNVVHIEVK